MWSMFWVTTKCNMKCKYCYEGEEKAGKIMSEKIADKAIKYTLERYEKLNVDVPLIVGFHGGEPLLQFELIKYIIEKFKNHFKNSSKKIYFSMTTNGVLLNEEISEYISRNIKMLSISFDGTKETHDTNRLLINGKGTYDIVSEKFVNLLKLRPNIRVRTTFNTITVNNLYEDVKFLVDLGFKTIVPAPDLFSKDWDTEHMEIMYGEMEKIKNLLSHNDEYSGVKVGIVDEEYEDNQKGDCLGGITSVHIDPEGNIYPCTYAVGSKEFIIGDVDKGISDSEGWINKMYELSKVENSDCKGCSRYKYCNGTRCKILNKIMTGDYHTPSAVLCAVENTKYKFFKDCKCTLV